MAIATITSQSIPGDAHAATRSEPAARCRGGPQDPDLGGPTELPPGAVAPVVTNDGAPVEVIVKLAPGAVRAGSPGHAAVHEIARRLLVELAPLYGPTTDPELASYAVAHIAPASAELVVQELLACDGVEGAYVKPPGEPPERSTRA